MKIISINAHNYRNIEDMLIRPCNGVNIIYGENAQGKTNLIEAIWLFTGCKSFRGSKDSELTGFGKDFSLIKLDFFGEEREQKAVIKIDGKRRASLNGVDLQSCTKLMGKFFAMVFSPVHLSLIKGGPQERRKFIDTAICQLKPKYISYLSEYSKVLSHRNALLRDIKYHPELYDTLEIWDARLAQLGAVIIGFRNKYTEILSEISKDVYSGLSRGREEIDISYRQSSGIDCSLEIKKIEEWFGAEITKRRREDIFSGVTSVGPHRDDISITLDNISARAFGSQGQQRSAALTLKMSEAELIERASGEKPIILLDDVMSELDRSRQDYILNKIEDRQVFITCCEADQVLRMHSGKAFEIKNGGLSL